jgi:hypothetical protein
MATVKVLFDNNASPKVSVDKHKVRVAQNTTEVITWVMDSRSTPGSVLAQHNGIKFKVPPPPPKSPWTQGPPKRNSDGSWQVTDVNDNATMSLSFAYEVNVTFNGQNFNLDPDIDNDPPPPVPGDDGDVEDDDDQGEGGKGHGHGREEKQST